MAPTPSKNPVAESKTAAAVEAPVAVEAPTPDRFVHPEAYSVIVLAPFDNFHRKYVEDKLAEEFTYLETPPTIASELKGEEMFPGVVVYLAYPVQNRERDKDTKRFELKKSLSVAGPIKLQEYFGKSRAGGGGLDLPALLGKVNDLLVSDPRGLTWCVRQTADGGFKIYDN